VVALTAGVRQTTKGLLVFDGMWRGVGAAFAAGPYAAPAMGKQSEGRLMRLDTAKDEQQEPDKGQTI
jgi:hypothetical protein